MKTLLVAMEDRLIVLQRSVGWHAEIRLQGKRLQCVARDPHRPERVYCGTSGHGLWRSDDAGYSWEMVGKGITHPHVAAVAVSPVERGTGYGIIYAGTEPSALFHSADGGETWQEQRTLVALPSASTWSFPPRPHTHHVRWITPDPVVADRLFVCIEAGALVRSLDRGQTWQDRTPQGPYDTHTLAAHPLVPGRLYAAAGDGYFESDDGGATWVRPRAGLRHHYLWSVAVDPQDPDLILASAADGPWQAHNADDAESLIYRRTARERWQPVVEGLPDPAGTTVSSLATDPAEPGVVYAANNQGVYRSSNAGLVWERLDIPWAEDFRSHRVQGLVVD